MGAIAGVNRRDFMKIAAVAGLSIVASSSLAACSNGEKTQSQGKEADFVVVGGGAGGVGAALHASEQGKSVILLEKCPCWAGIRH